MSTRPLVSIITINYNQASVTCDLLRSIAQLEYAPIEVIVVDNASKTDPTEDVLKTYPDARVIRNEQNLGFAAGNNVALKVANGEFFFLVNNDTELAPNVIQPLLDIFKTYPDAGGVSPKFHYYFHPGIVEYAGYEKVNPLTARNKMIGSKQKDQGQFNRIMETHYMHGGGMMVPKYVVKQVGLMPDSYFLYYEELDWSEMIKRAGYKIYYQPEALIHHKESMTTGKNSVLKTYYLNRNRLLFMRRNAGILSLISFCVYLCLFTIPKNVITFLIKREFDHLKAFTRGLLWNFSHSKNTTSLGEQ